MPTCFEYEDVSSVGGRYPHWGSTEEGGQAWRFALEDSEATESPLEQPDLSWEQEARKAFSQAAKSRRKKINALLAIVSERLGALIGELEEARLRNQVRLSRPDAAIAAANKFLAEVYRLSSEKKVHTAGDLIFDFVQKLLRNGNLRECQRLFTTVDVSKLDPVLLVTFLSTTFEARHKLQSCRDEYFAKVLRVLSRTRGAEAASKLLDKYR